MKHDFSLAKNGVAFILPLYTGFCYGRKALQSFFAHVPAAFNPFAIVLDDASPNYKEQDWDAWYSGLPVERCYHHAYSVNKGLTRSWNEGLKIAREAGSRYAITGNSDLLFTEGFLEPLMFNLDNESLALIGPLSNAPGRNNANDCKQQIAKFVDDFQLTDDPAYLTTVARKLRQKYPLQQIEKTDINGFCMMAKTATWWQGAFDADRVFDPRNRMTGNEDELGRRWRKRGLPTGFSACSFVWHYRGVSRGFKSDDVGVYRMTDMHAPV